MRTGCLYFVFFFSSVQFSSIAQSCPTLCDPMNRSTPGLHVHYQPPEFTQTHGHRVSDAIQHLILCCPLLLLPRIPPSIRVFSNESTLCMKWPKYWSFSFSIIPSKEHQKKVSPKPCFKLLVSPSSLWEATGFFLIFTVRTWQSSWK